ncbi:MAG: hypothetical protein U1E76_07835 [Planctomycetota bacterium]
MMILQYAPPDPLGEFIAQTGRWSEVHRVEVDGVAAPVHAAFYHFIAVPIPSGRHRLRVSFKAVPAAPR